MADRTAVIEPGDDDLVLTYGPGRFDLKVVLLSGDLRRTMEGASTLTVTVADESNTLLTAGVLEQDSETSLSSLRFRLVAIDRNADRTLSLEFEDREVAILRDHNRHRKMSRGKVTRARFAKTLVDEIPSIGFRAPAGVDKRQPIKARAKRDEKIGTDKSYAGGIADDAELKVKKRQADSAQIDRMERVMAVAEELDAPILAVLAMLCANIGESDFGNNPGPNNVGAEGLFQLLPKTQREFNLDPDDIEGGARVFLNVGFTQGRNGKRGAIQLAKAHPDWSPGRIASEVEGSDANGAFYDLHAFEALAITKAYNGDFSKVDSTTRTYSKAYEFSRGKPGGPEGEDSWDCLQRLASEVRWRCFMREGVVIFANDDTLAKAKPVMTVQERGGAGEQPGKGVTLVNAVTFQLERLDERQRQRKKHRKRLKRVSEATVTCEAALWAADPGSVVQIRDLGPANGRWLVWDVARDLHDPTTTITLRRPQPALPEPAAELATSTKAGETLASGSERVFSGSIRERVVDIAKESARMSKADPTAFLYSQSGAWHGDPLSPVRKPRGTERSDCSEWVISVYDKAGCDLPASMTGQGFTGTLASEGHKTDSPRPGDVCLYGTYPYRHVELYVGNGKTIGHGSDPVDGATPNAISGFAGYWTFPFLNGEAKRIVAGNPDRHA